MSFDVTPRSNSAATRYQADRLQKVVVVSYVALAAAPLIYAAAHAWFWESKHRMAPVAVAAFAVVLIALVFRRRWAWLLLVVFQVAVLVGDGRPKVVAVDLVEPAAVRVGRFATDADIYRPDLIT